MERWAGKVALITGVSTGIGKAAATKLLKHGMKVIGCARRAEVLQVVCCIHTCTCTYIRTYIRTYIQTYIHVHT